MFLNSKQWQQSIVPGISRTHTHGAVPEVCAQRGSCDLASLHPGRALSTEKVVPFSPLKGTFCGSNWGPTRLHLPSRERLFLSHTKAWDWPEAALPMSEISRGPTHELCSQTAC